MRQPSFLLAGVLCAAMPASAQVTVDLHALDALRPVQKAPSRRAPAKPAKPAQQPLASTQPNKPSPQEPVASTGAAAPQETPAPSPPPLPAAPPPTIALAPVPEPPPSVQAPPPPPPPISDTSTSAASATGAGLRVTFGPEEADLSPSSAAAIQNLVRTAPQGDNVSVNVTAYAAGTPEDPSTARRLSLSRALAVRSALIANGLSSARIYVRALGAQAGEGPADRVDLSLLGGNASAPAPAGSTQGQAPATPQPATPSGQSRQQ
jgi:outer membrane protein OmpA-like peptidoglycan-associated protein